MTKFKLALMVPLEEYQDRLKALQSIEELELTSIYSPESNSDSFYFSEEQQVPVFSNLDLFLSKLSCNVLVDALGIPGIENKIIELGKSHIVLIAQDQFGLFDVLVKRLMEAIKKIKLSEAIMEAAQEGIQVVDANGTIIYANSSFVRITKIPLEERIGKNIFEVSPDGSLAEVLRKGTAVFGNTHVTRGVPIIANASPIIIDGKFAGAVTVFSDVSSIERMAKIIQHGREEIASLKDAIHRMNPAKYSLSDLIGRSPKFLKCLELARRAAETQSTVLITGESGTGKELFAHGIHRQGDRFQGPFIKVNCPAIPPTLMESELFGHEKGAFTGADKQKMGKFELANGGTIFLDEIGDMDLTLQAKLLRVIQEREFERIGGNRPIRVNVRIIAATNRDLPKLIKEGLFREDLFYRLNVIHIHIPPLRERPEDIPLLVDHMIKKFYYVHRRDNTDQSVPPSIEQSALDELCAYSWPGNVRELENLIEKVMIFHKGPTITREEIVAALYDEATLPTVNINQGMTLKEMERRMIMAALERHGYSLAGKKAAAAELGISLTTLYGKLKKFKIKPDS